MRLGSLVQTILVLMTAIGALSACEGETEEPSEGSSDEEPSQQINSGDQPIQQDDQTQHLDDDIETDGSDDQDAADDSDDSDDEDNDDDVVNVKLSYEVSVTVSNLSGEVTIANNDDDLLTIDANGTFSFSQTVTQDDPYDVTIVTHPAAQVCFVQNGSGTMANAAITDVTIECGCDLNLEADSDDPIDAARAIGMCEGLNSATWELPDGTTNALSPAENVTDDANFALGHGLLSAFGSNIQVPDGLTMLALSTGTARAANHVGYQSPTTTGFRKGYSINLPLGLVNIPSVGDGSACPAPSNNAYDGITLRVTMTVPQGVNAFRMRYLYLTSDYPDETCSQFIDQVGVFATTSSQTDANMLLTTAGNPVNANSLDLDICSGAANCMSSAELFGTGFEGRGGINWRQTETIAVTPGETITIRMMIWDTNDGDFDSTVLFDGFEWLNL